MNVYKLDSSLQLCVAGFCDPKRDVAKDDLALWLASSDAAPNNLDDEQVSIKTQFLRRNFALQNAVFCVAIFRCNTPFYRIAILSS